MKNQVTSTSVYPYRVFVSYSHEDQSTFEDLRKVLEAHGLCVLSDCDIGAGTPFTDAIRGLISHAHLFMPLITRSAKKKPWVHQGTGFAMARDIPILPIVLEDAKMPTEMIAQLQAIKVKSDLSDLLPRLRKTELESLIFPRPGPPAQMVMIAESPEDRSRLFADCANRVRHLGHAGRLRQRGALSSFCIPDADIHHKVWKEREGKEGRSDYYRLLQRRERQALEWHATQAGCRLIIDSGTGPKYRTPKEVLVRLRTLLKFLRSPKCQAEIVLSPLAKEGNLTLVGDWFVAESQIPRTYGYRQTVFNWHAPTVTRSAREFDNLFDDLCREQKLDPAVSEKEAIISIERRISEYARGIKGG